MNFKCKIENSFVLKCEEFNYIHHKKPAVLANLLSYTENFFYLVANQITPFAIQSFFQDLDPHSQRSKSIFTVQNLLPLIILLFKIVRPLVGYIQFTDPIANLLFPMANLLRFNL